MGELIKGDCNGCRFAIEDSNDRWGPEHFYCNNPASVHHTYMTPDDQTCAHRQALSSSSTGAGE